MPTLDRPRIEYRTPVDLVAEVVRGQLRIPPFQRSFKWESADVVALLDSILRGFPIGNLLFWRRPAPAAEVRVGPLTINAPEIHAANWVVDGQQRITSLVGALTEQDAPDPRFRIYLNLRTGSFHSLSARQQPRPFAIPVSRLAATTSLLSWLRDNADWTTDDDISMADRAAEAIREYQIPAYVVTTDDEQSLRQIFDRLNNYGKHLDRAEVFHALHSGFAGDGPADLTSLGAVPAQAGFGAFDERLALRCVLAYRGGDVFREEFADEFTSDDDRADTFREVASSLRTVVDLLRGEAGIPHVKLLPYSHVVPVLIRYVRNHGEPTARLAQLLRRWIWRDATTGVATGGVSVPVVRRALAAVDHPDAYEAVATLLRSTDTSEQFRPRLDRTNLQHAAARINALGLAASHPRDLVTGLPLELPSLLDKGNPLEIVVPHSTSRYAPTFANRIISGTTAVRPVRELILAAPDDVLSSLLIDHRARDMLVNDHLEGFLEHRFPLVESTVITHVEAMAERGARDGRSIADMMKSGA